MATKSFKTNKLVRDQTAHLMLAKGIIMHNTVLDKEEFIQKLKDKLLEECREVVESRTLDELLEEFADVLEVIHALSTAAGLSMKQLEEKRIEKRKKSGGFEGRIFSNHVDIEEDNPAINYLSKIKKYPLISH